MKTRGFLLALTATLVLGPAAVPAEALLFTGSDQGVNIELNTSLTGSTLGVSLTLATSGYSGPGTSLHAISLKLTNGIDLSDITVVTLPILVANWTTALGQINANTTGPGGNQLGSGSGFFSSFWNLNNTGVLVPNGIYAFNYTLDITGFNLVDAPSFKAIYVDLDGNKANGITSISLSSPVPEPGTLLLIASGLVGIGVGARRRHRRT